MMLCYSKTRKKNFLDSPPPKKKRVKDTNDRDMSTRTSVCLYIQSARDLDIHLVEIEQIE